MSLLIMAVYDTEDNKRTDLTRRTCASLFQTVDFTKHRLIIVDNASCSATKSYLKEVNTWQRYHHRPTQQPLHDVKVITNETNLGTAGAVNLGLLERLPGEHCIKLDNDVVFHKLDWVEEMEDCIRRMPSIGILGLKRKDIQESTYALNMDQRSRLLEVPHSHGEPWRVVEKCKHVMGTCTMINYQLLDQIGYFYQMDGLYGFDDSLLCIRSTVSGFDNCFMHGVEIDHIDQGGNEYTKWKSDYAGTMLQRYAETERSYINGTLKPYHNPYEQL